LREDSTDAPISIKHTSPDCWRADSSHRSTAPYLGRCP